MIFSEHEERKLRESIRTKNIAELKRHRSNLAAKLKEAEKARTFYTKLLPKKDKLDPRNAIILAGIQDEFPKIEDLNSTIKRIKDYQKSINTILGSPEKIETTTPSQSKVAGKVSRLVSDYEEKIRRESASTPKTPTTAKAFPLSQLRQASLKQFAVSPLKHEKVAAQKQKRELHPNILSSDLKNGALLTVAEIKTVHEAVAKEKAAGRNVIKIKRTRARTGAKLDKLSDLEKRLKLNYSVIVIPPEGEHLKESTKKWMKKMNLWWHYIKGKLEL